MHGEGSGRPVPVGQRPLRGSHEGHGRRGLIPIPAPQTQAADANGLEHRESILRALLLAAVLSVLSGGAALCQEADYFPEEQKPRLVFQWDFLARYDRIEKLIFRPDIFRGRFEARPELDLVFSQRFRIGARAVGDVGTDSNATNDANFDNYRSNGAALERYFVEAKPGPLALRLGSFGMPFVATEMLWDHDIQTLGASAAWEVPLGSSTLTVAGGAFRGP
ncbi:MAG TPA: putative porin, partial [Thermoanaerobaculia bacterium]